MNEPDLVLFVGEALVGNEAVDQLVKFNQALADHSSKENPHLIDGIVLTKFDTIDDKVRRLPCPLDEALSIFVLFHDAAAVPLLVTEFYFPVSTLNCSDTFRLGYCMVCILFYCEPVIQGHSIIS